MTDVILATSTIEEHFEQAIDEAIERFRLNPQQATLNYLVRLLCEFIRRPVAEIEAPLGLEMVQTETTAPEHLIPKLKRIADDALYLSGFMREYVNGRSVGVDYYRTIGGTAYRRLSVLLRRRRPTPELADVYGELSEEFRDFTDVLAEVRMQSLGASEDLGRLYEAWMRSESKVVEAKLREAGFVELDRSTRKLAN